eukprot:TRINITY_DN1347_c0_g1_i1.p1 TRINITY_DN1347_c0_g1~~TRINITY_DN1347_c0_g1_i1.p1  ORF type:complete len:204 (-),score=36.34 TRINITY_DN1347_c0_g1_i1:28-639(-)
MKAPHLCLSYRDKGDVSVCQSSRYMHCSDTQAVIEETYRQGEFFTSKGFEVLRHKIECLASCKGVPKYNEESEHYPNRYFEFHIRVRKKGSEGDDSEELAITEDEVQWLKDISEEYSQKFMIPVPLSFSYSKRGQRYLNCRFGGCGSELARSRANAIRDRIQQSKTLEWVKTISEYVWYDDNREMDSGWIDFTPQELQVMFTA